MIFYVERQNKKSLGSAKGIQPKWQGNGIYAKADQLGYEGLSEEFVSKFISICTDLACVPYTSVSLQERDTGLFKGTGCICENYNKQGFLELTLSDILQNKGYTEAQLLSTVGVERWKQYMQVLNDSELLTLLHVIQLDALILNDDRHLMNIAFMIDPSGTRQFAPVYDNGAALFSDESLYSYKRTFAENREKYISRTLELNYTDTLKFLKGLNVPLLRVDENKAYMLINSYTNALYKSIQVSRCKRILQQQLKETRGVLWQSV